MKGTQPENQLARCRTAFSQSSLGTHSSVIVLGLELRSDKDRKRGLVLVPPATGSGSGLAPTKESYFETDFLDPISYITTILKPRPSLEVKGIDSSRKRR